MKADDAADKAKEAEFIARLIQIKQGQINEIRQQAACLRQQAQVGCSSTQIRDSAFIFQAKLTCCGGGLCTFP